MILYNNKQFYFNVLETVRFVTFIRLRCTRVD